MHSKKNFEKLCVTMKCLKYHPLFGVPNQKGQLVMLCPCWSEDAASYFPITQAERNQSLKSTWENHLKSWQIIGTSVENVDQLSDPSKMRVNAKRNLEITDLNRISIFPFAGSSAPIHNPSVWPKNRSQPIILPHALTEIDINRIRVPNGWSLADQSNLKKTNDVGAVSDTAVQERNVITVKRDYVIKRNFLGAGEEGKLKPFIAWMQEVNDRTVTVFIPKQ